MNAVKLNMWVMRSAGGRNEYGEVEHVGHEICRGT